MLKVDHIHKYFKGQPVLKDISFEAQEGEVFGIIGPNGAGKSTLLKILSGIMDPDSGTVVFNGKKLSIQESSAWGYLPEERGLYPSMTVVAQLIHFAALKGYKRAEAAAKAKEMLSRLGMDSDSHRQMAELSKGNQQRIQFLAAILHDPLLVILDEPFSGLDPIQTEWLKKQIVSFKAQGKIVLYSSHRMESVEQLCDRVLLLHKGETQMSDTLDNWRNTQQEVWELVIMTNSYAIKGVKVLSQETLTGQCTIRFVLEGKSMASVFVQLEEDGIAVQSFRRYLPGLQELFIHYTTNERL